MKRLVLAIILIAVVTACTKEEETIGTPGGMTASDGTFIGIVHLTCNKVEDASVYSFERKNPNGGNWVDLSWHSWNTCDDNGWALTNDKIVPGQKYEYRVRVHRDGPGFSEYSAIDKGHPFKTEAITITEIKSAQDPMDGTADNVTVFWKDSLSENILNLVERRYTVKFAEETNLGQWIPIETVVKTTLSDKEFSITAKLPKTRAYRYRVDSEFTYSLTQGQEHTTSYYAHEGNSFAE